MKLAPVLAIEIGRRMRMDSLPIRCGKDESKLVTRELGLKMTLAHRIVLGDWLISAGKRSHKSGGRFVGEALFADGTRELIYVQ